MTVVVCIRVNFHHGTQLLVVDLRQTLIYKATETKADFLLLNDVEKLKRVVENHCIYVAKFIVDAMKESLYSTTEIIHLLPVLYTNRGIKHDFPFINIRKVPREVLKTEGEARGFQPSRGTLRMLMNDKIMFDR